MVENLSSTDQNKGHRKNVCIPCLGINESLLSSCYVPGTVWGPESQSTEHRRKISLLSSLCSGMGKEVDVEYK